MSPITPRLGYYVLDENRRPVRVDDWRIWGEFFENITNRIVDYTDITSEIYVSTVFIGIDHRFFDSKGPPLVFETLIFGGPKDGYMRRYSSWDDAEIGHRAAVRRARAAIGQKVTS